MAGHPAMRVVLSTYMRGTPVFAWLLNCDLLRERVADAISSLNAVPGEPALIDLQRAAGRASRAMKRLVEGLHVGHVQDAPVAIKKRDRQRDAGVLHPEA